MFGLLVLTTVSIFANFMLDKLKKDDYQKWLDQLPWGKHPNRRNWSKSDNIGVSLLHDTKLAEEALFDLQTIIQQPIAHHQRLEKTRVPLGWQDSPKSELCGLVLKVQIPSEISRTQVTIRTNITNEDNSLPSTEWLMNTEWDSARESSIKSERYNTYQVTLPANDSDSYLAFNVSYGDNDNPIQKQQYYFQHSIKQDASYSAITDNSRQQQIESQLSKETAELSI
jgi:hypothetical protein